MLCPISLVKLQFSGDRQIFSPLQLLATATVCLFCLDLKLSSVLVRFSCLNCSSILVLCCVSIQFSTVQFNFPYAGSLLPKDNVETFPTRGYLPWEEAGRRSSKKFHRGFPVPGLISTCCQSRPKSITHMYKLFCNTENAVIAF